MMTTFSQLCECINNSCDPAACTETVYVGLEHIDSGAFHFARWGLPTQVHSAKSRFQPGDILYGKLRPYLDKAILADREGICSTDILVFRPKPNVCGSYVLCVVHSAEFLQFAIQHTNGVNHPRTSWSNLRRFECDVPPLPYQEKIAAVLCKTQRAAELEQKLATTTRELKTAAMRQLFSAGLSGEPQKETEIGTIPKSWNVMPLEKLAKIGNGSTPKKTISAYWQGGSLPWLTSAKVYDQVIQQADQFVTPLAAKECHLPRVPANSLVVAITGQGKTLGHVARVAIDTFVSQHLAYITFSDKTVSTEFMRQYLSTRYEHFRQVSQGYGSTKGALTCAFLKSCMVPVPNDPDEQTAIAAALRTIDRKIAVHERRAATHRELFASLLHHLMTGEVRVDKLDVDVSEVRA